MFLFSLLYTLYHLDWIVFNFKHFSPRTHETGLSIVLGTLLFRLPQVLFPEPANCHQGSFCNRPLGVSVHAAGVRIDYRFWW